MVPTLRSPVTSLTAVEIEVQGARQGFSQASIISKPMPAVSPGGKQCLGKITDSVDFFPKIFSEG